MWVGRIDRVRAFAAGRGSTRAGTSPLPTAPDPKLRATTVGGSELCRHGSRASGGDQTRIPRMNRRLGGFLFLFAEANQVDSCRWAGGSCGTRRAKAGIGVFARISAMLEHVDEIHMGNPGQTLSV